MTVMPSTVIALWSEGPAPPRRLSTPGLRISQPHPEGLQLVDQLRRSACGDCGVAASSARRSHSPLVDRRSGHAARSISIGARRTIIENEAEKLGPRIMADRIHHPLALDDEAMSRSAISNPLALRQRRARDARLPARRSPSCSRRAARLRSFSSGEIFAICSSVSQPVALTTKQPLSSA